MKLNTNIPDKKDIRWALLITLFFYAIVLLKNPAFGKSYYLVALIFSVITISDISLNYILNKRFHIPLSGMTSSIGIILLVYSSNWTLFILIALLASFSKYFIKTSNLHIFNPNNFAMVMAFFFFSSEVSSTVGKWNFDSTMIVLMICFGLVLSTIAKRVLVSLSFIFFYALFAGLRTYYLNDSITFGLLPFYAPTFYLFSFYHITDPITTPSNYKGMIIFGISLALIDNVLRSFNLLYTPFYSYFILASIQPFFKTIFNRPYNRIYTRVTTA